MVTNDWCIIVSAGSHYIMLSEIEQTQNLNKKISNKGKNWTLEMLLPSVFRASEYWLSGSESE